MLTKYGTDNIIVMLILSMIFIVAAGFLNRLSFTGAFIISIILGLLGVILAVFTFWFFRDPERTVPEEALNNEMIIISPADGKVIEVVDEIENRFLKCQVKRISIFLSPLDVHVNRIPMSGVVKFFEFTAGDYLVAYHPKASELNEQTYIGVENSRGKKILFKQIVGILARRLVWDIKEGDTVKVGNRFGMMKFGSRMDIMVLPDTEIFVKSGDKVKAGESIIAKIPE